MVGMTKARQPRLRRRKLDLKAPFVIAAADVAAVTDAGVGNWWLHSQHGLIPRPDIPCGVEDLLHTKLSNDGRVRADVHSSLGYFTKQVVQDSSITAIYDL